MDSLRKSPPAEPPFIPDRKSGYFSHDSSFAGTLSDLPALPARRSDRSRVWRKTILWTFVALLAAAFGIMAFFLFKSLSISRSIQVRNDSHASFFSDAKRLAVSYFQKKRAPLSGEEIGRINILLLGRAGEHYPGRNLTDTVMVMSIDTVSKKVSLLSLPRDLYAPIPDTGLYTKINSLYQYGLSQDAGVEPLRASVENITGQKIDYFFILDFDGFEKAVDALGGIQVEVLRDFYDTRYPGKNYSYETFEVKKGWQTLDGATALKYVRERHNDPEGDFGRAKRQQQVIQAIKDKAFSLGTFFNVFALNGLLDALGESVKTDMTSDDMEGFLRLAKTLDTENISSVVIDAWKKGSLLRVSHIQVGPVAAFILVPRVGNWSEIRDVSENIFRLDELKSRHERIAAEQPTITILYAPGDIAIAEKMRLLAAEQMGFSEVSLLPLDILENRPEQSIITDRSGLRKPYGLDELLKKFSLKKEDFFPYTLPETDASDFAIVIGDDLAEDLSFEEENISTLPDDPSFSEPLPPQPKKNRGSGIGN